MKKVHARILILLVAIVSSLNLLSCNKDEKEDPGQGSNSELVGKWFVDKITIEFYTKVPELEDILNGTQTEDGDGEYWVFTETKLTTYDKYGDPEDDPIDYIYDKDKGKLYVDDMEDAFNVLTLTKDRLVLYAEVYEGLVTNKITIEFYK